MLAALLPLEFSVRTSVDIPDTQCVDTAGILRSFAWPHRAARIRECKLQKARWHTGGELNHATAVRLLTGEGEPPFPPALAESVVRELAPAPRTRRQRDAMDRRQQRLEGYPASCAELVSLVYISRGDTLSLRAQPWGWQIGCDGAGAMAFLPPLPKCYVQFVLEEPFVHAYFEDFISTDPRCAPDPERA